MGMKRVLWVVASLLLTCGLCGGTACLSLMNKEVNSTKIIFNSPSFPQNYPRPLSCKWLLTAPENSVINFRIMTFDVFPTIFCLKDVFDIYDGDSKYAPLMQSWCGSRNAGQVVQSSTRYVVLTFQAVTNGDDHQGFEFEVWSEIQIIYVMGEAELTPAHLTLAAVSVAICLLFMAVGTIVVKKRCEEWKKLRDRDSS